MSFRIAYPVGDTPHRDCQYWPTILREELRDVLISEGITNTNEQNRFMDRNWPIAIDQPTLMHLMWKVREWELAASVLTYTGSRNPVVPGGTWTLSVTLPQLNLTPQRQSVPDTGPRDVRDEQDLLGPSTDMIRGTRFNAFKTCRNMGTFDIGADADIIVVETDDAVLNTGASFNKSWEAYFTGGNYVIYDPIPKLFYVNLFLDLTISSIVSGPVLQMYCLPVTPTATPDSSPAFGLAGDVQQGTLTIHSPVIGNPDILVPLGMFGSSGGLFPPAWDQGGTGSCDLEMTPVKWWPYKTSTGAPVYDEDTGETINDPFS